jgi:hypothetical protein
VLHAREGASRKKSLKKYGPRKDDRPTARRQVLDILAKVAAPKIIVKTDQCPQYAALIKAALPQKPSTPLLRGVEDAWWVKESLRK